jgi:hypothetical protein
LDSVNDLTGLLKRGELGPTDTIKLAKALGKRGAYDAALRALDDLAASPNVDSKERFEAAEAIATFASRCSGRVPSLGQAGFDPFKASDGAG